MAAGRRALGRIAGSMAGSVISSGLGAVKGLAGSIATAARGLTNLENQKEQPAEQAKQSTNVIYVNFGMAGSAGRQKVAGTGTLPAPKAVKVSGVNQNMPTDKLLNAAIKYLTSINSTLKKQLEFDKHVYDQSVTAERESAIESPINPFGNIKDRLSGLTDTSGAVDRTKNLFSGKNMLTALGLVGAASLIAGSLDESEYEKLAANIDKFKQDYKWLFDLSASIGTGVGVGGFAGYLARGIKGIIPGMLIGAVANYFGAQNIAAGGAIGYLGYRAFKSGSRLSSMSSSFVGSKFVDARSNLSLAKNVGGSYKSAGGRVGTTSQFFASSRWRNFMAWLAKRGKRQLVLKIERRIAIAASSAALTASGAGAVVGVLGILLSVFGNLYLAYEIYQLWQEWESDEKTKQAGASDAEIINEINPPDAVAQTASAATPALAANRIVSKSETGRPEEAQAFFESRGWTREQAAGIVGNLVVESGLRTDAVGDGGKAYGIAQWHPDRQAVFRKVYGKDIRDSSFQEQMEYVDWELKNTEARAGKLLRSATTAEEAAAIVDRSYERSAGIHITERQANAAAIMAGDYAKVSTGGAAGYEGSGGKVGAMATNAIETTARVLGGVAGQLVGKTTLKSTSTPIMSADDKSQEIGKKSSELDSIMKFGALDAQKKATKTPPTPTAVLKSASPSGTISVIDPNWHGLGDSTNALYKYLANFKMVA